MRILCLSLDGSGSWIGRTRTAALDNTPRPVTFAFEFPYLVPQEAVETLDAGRAHQNGKPADTIFLGKTTVPHFRRDEAPQTLLGVEQRAWLIDRLKTSRATWKVWGNSLGSLDWRADPQNLPKGIRNDEGVARPDLRVLWRRR